MVKDTPPVSLVKYMKACLCFWLAPLAILPMISVDGTGIYGG
jgi:hypothetical protein